MYIYIHTFFLFQVERLQVVNRNSVRVFLRPDESGSVSEQTAIARGTNLVLVWLSVMSVAAVQSG